MSRALVLLCMIGACAANHQIGFHNNCPYTVWVGLYGNPYNPESGGFELRSGQTHTSNVTNHWSGRIWGRTHCGGSQCETGDCGGGKIHLVDGYNLQMSIAPRQGTFNPGRDHYYCTRAGCNTDLNRICPSELQVHGTGGVVACMNAFMKFNRDDYCCRGAHRTPNTCPPFSYSQTFKQACPNAYSYAYDDQSTTFTCNGHGTGTTAYDIYFC
ncbi:hypothetical protein ACJMK2_019818 [Sinanodonta woodiana]|uniref:Thaumatin-like protein n=1 Tax=Sinanodonta woodiana TaxID=1069815 RepID=A0ABD3TXC5_SINWO